MCLQVKEVMRYSHFHMVIMRKLTLIHTSDKVGQSDLNNMDWPRVLMYHIWVQNVTIITDTRGIEPYTVVAKMCHHCLQTDGQSKDTHYILALSYMNIAPCYVHDLIEQWHQIEVWSFLFGVVNIRESCYTSCRWKVIEVRSDVLEFRDLLIPHSWTPHVHTALEVYQ